MDRKPRRPALSFGTPDSSLVPWQPSTCATPPVELRRPVAGRLLTTVGVTAFIVGLLVVLGAFIGFLGPLLLAIGVVACGLLVVIWVLYSAAVESLMLRERVLLQRRWWGGLQRTRLEDIATVVYLPKYGHSHKDGWQYLPYLVLLDAGGHRLHKLRCATWSESQLETVAALLPSATKLKVTGRIDWAGLRKFDRRYPGLRRWR